MSITTFLALRGLHMLHCRLSLRFSYAAVGKAVYHMEWSRGHRDALVFDKETTEAAIQEAQKRRSQMFRRSGHLT
jgi:hypothetical protein